MKKIALLLAIAFSFALSSSAMSLQEAYKALSNIPNISVNREINSPLLGLFENADISMASSLNESQIAESGTAVLTILNQVPLTRMINGGNNNHVGAFVYASPDSKDGIYETLVVLMSGKLGDITVIYGGISQAAKNALQSAPLTMTADTIRIHTILPDGTDFNIEAE